ncbi:UNVERIFIED_CONTAM: hypothetical protein Scaly_0049300 [Sesamum calycinum]|uniref:DUF8040 domain-containing protein n=1 Tax=Sesamum calycinum TaxID=2727403 RepID=A0AAW2SU07_9LAMI
MIVHDSCLNSPFPLCLFCPQPRAKPWRVLVRELQTKQIPRVAPLEPRTPGSTESDVPEEFYAFRDLICPELFREKVPRNTSALQVKDGGLLPHGQTSRVSSIEEVALFMQTVGMHKRQRDNMERFQHSLETINRRFHRVLSALCAMAPELITRPNFTDTHSRVASNIDFYPYFKANEIILESHFYIFSPRCRIVSEQWTDFVPAWVPQIDQNRYRSRKGRLAQNVLAICDFDMNFTYVYAGWEGKYYLVDAGFTNYQCFLAPYRGMAYRRYLERSGFPQEDHWTLSVEQRLMWMIVDDNTRDSMRDDHRAEAHMAHWARGLRRHFGYHYTREQLYPLARRYYQYPEPHYPSMLEIWGPLDCPLFQWRGRVMHAIARIVTSCVAMREVEEAPIMISNSTTPTAQTHTHIGSWDAVQQVAHGDGGPRLRGVFH